MVPRACKTRFLNHNSTWWRSLKYFRVDSVCAKIGSAQTESTLKSFPRWSSFHAYIEWEVRTSLYDKSIAVNISLTPKHDKSWAQESIPRNQFRQHMYPGGPVRQPYPYSVPSPHRFQPCAGIFNKHSMGPRNRVERGLLYRPARLHRLVKLIPWNRFLHSIKVLKFGLWMASQGFFRFLHGIKHKNIYIIISFPWRMVRLAGETGRKIME
jgi:hypothetical protein